METILDIHVDVLYIFVSIYVHTILTAYFSHAEKIEFDLNCMFYGVEVVNIHTCIYLKTRIHYINFEVSSYHIEIT